MDWGKVAESVVANGLVGGAVAFGGILIWRWQQRHKRRFKNRGAGAGCICRRRPKNERNAISSFGQF